MQLLRVGLKDREVEIGSHMKSKVSWYCVILGPLRTGNRHKRRLRAEKVVVTGKAGMEHWTRDKMFVGAERQSLRSIELRKSYLTNISRQSLFWGKRSVSLSRRVLKEVR